MKHFHIFYGMGANRINNLYRNIFFVINTICDIIYNMWYNYWFQISWYAEKHTFTYYFTFENKGGIIFLPYFALKYTIPSTCKISTKINRTTYLTTPFVYFRYRRQLTRTPFKQWLSVAKHCVCIFFYWLCPCFYHSNFKYGRLSWQQ